jgi:hypothetical protein
MARWAVLSGLVAVGEAAFYLPGVAPKSYKTRDNVRSAQGRSLAGVQRALNSNDNRRRGPTEALL